MPARTTRAGERAEARRRARLAARGEEYAGEAEDVEQDEPPPRQSLLQRLVPPAAPLRGKGDPLAGLSYEGPMRPVVAALFLLRRNVIAWIAPGLLYVVGLEIALLGREQQTTLLIVQLLQYTMLIAAGWIGWQRPWLFGVAAALLGNVGSALLLGYLSTLAIVPFSPLTYIASEALFTAFLGFVAGWYGGYLRRRLADQRPSRTAAKDRRR